MLTGRELIQAAKAKQAARQTSNSPEWHSLVHPRQPHEKQRLFLESPAKRKVIRAGRRGGKTTGIAILSARAFMAGRRILYGAPTEDQVETFWWEIKSAFNDAIDAGYLYKNETKHVIELPGTKTRIRAKTAWNADTLRGDYADLLILDEFQLMAEDTWGVVGAPMLLDNDGDAVFIYTPPSLHNATRTKAKDPRHAAKMYKKAEADETGRWQAFHFTSRDNPHISEDALNELTSDMTALAIRQEIEAEDSDDIPGALWSRQLIETTRKTELPTMRRIVIGVDPPGGLTEAGIVVGGLGDDGHGYVLEDISLRASPGEWGKAVVDAYHRWKADRIIGEKNYGGDMVENTIRTVEGGKNIAYRSVVATRGKAVRAEPIAAQFEHGKAHLAGEFPHLENEMCGWVPGSPNSPNRLDAMVWAFTELMLDGQAGNISDEVLSLLSDYRG
jgi:hypothetical protein